MWSALRRGGGGAGGCRLTQQRAPPSFEWAPLPLSPADRSAHLSASRSSRRVVCPRKGVGPSPFLRFVFKKKEDYHFWWGTFSKTAVINENGRDETGRQWQLVALRVKLEFVNSITGQNSARTQKISRRRQDKFITGCFHSFVHPHKWQRLYNCRATRT